MQSLDSSCQEADFIINDTLKKLKGSSTSINSNSNSNSTTLTALNSSGSSSSILRQQHPHQQLIYQQHQPIPQQSKPPHYTHYQHLQTALQCPATPQQPQPLTSPPPPPTPLSSVTFSTKSSLLDSSLLHCNISQIPSQPPYCIFDDGTESPSEVPPVEILATSSSSSVGGGGGGNIGSTSGLDGIVLLAETSTTTPAHGAASSAVPSPSSCSSSTNLSNFNSITSPSPVVPDLLLSTPPGVNSSSLAESSANTLATNTGYGSMGTSAFLTSLTQSSHFSTTTSTHQSNNNNITITSNNKKADKRPSASLSTQQQQHSNHSHHHQHHYQQSSTHHHPPQHLLSASSPLAGAVSSVSPTSSPSKRQKLLKDATSRSSPSTSTTRASGNKRDSNAATPSSSATSTSSTGATSSTLASSKFFNIHDKIREHYLQLLANDLNSFTETGLKQRSRAFVLERLIESEKVNTIVINLYPGNKGYSLALHYDDRQLLTPNGELVHAGDGSGIDPGVGGAESGQAGTSSSASATTYRGASSRNTGSSSSKLSLAAIPPDLKGGNDYENIVELKLKGTGRLDENSHQHEYSLVEVLRWPYENDQLLQCIDREVIPDFLVDMLNAPSLTLKSSHDDSEPARTYAKPNVFYAGCVIAQIRDFRQTFAISTNICDTKHVLLRPTNATIFADVQHLASTTNLSISPITSGPTAAAISGAEDKLQLESQLVLATAEPLCLDPDPNIGRFAINAQNARQLFNTHELRRQMKKYTQISINRKRKLDQFTHHYGLELCDYLTRLRARPRTSSSANANVTATTAPSSNPLVSAMLTSFSSKVPRRPRDVIRPIRPPRLEYPANLKVPEQLISVEKYTKTYERPRETTDCQPQLIEEYVLETEREENAGRRVIYHIKLSIFQRPSNSEYLGELYVDRDYREGERNGESCRFSLGTRIHANRYIQQFTEIFTEEGRKAVKITHLVPGHLPKVTHTGITPEQRQALLLQQRQAALLAQQQQQHVQHVATATANAQHAAVTASSSGAQQSQQQHVVLVGPNGQQQHILPANVQHLGTVGHQQQVSQTVCAVGGGVQQQHQQQQHIAITPTGGNLTKNINIVGLTASNAVAVQQVLRQQQLQQQQQQQQITTQFIEANGATMHVQTSSGSVSGGTGIIHAQPQQQPTQHIQLHSVAGGNAHTTTQLSLSNGSLVLVQQHPLAHSQQQQQQQAQTLQHTGITIQPANLQQQQQQQKTQVITAAQLNAVTGANSALRTQLSSSVPILQAQLKAAPLLTAQQQQQLLHKTTQQQQSTASSNNNSNSTTLHTNPAINAIFTNIMNSANQFQQQKQQQQQQQQQLQQNSNNSSSGSNVSGGSSSVKSSSNASIRSLLNSAPAAMTSTPVASGTFTTSTGQHQTVTLVQHTPSTPQQQQLQQTIGSGDNFVQVTSQSSTVAAGTTTVQQRKQTNNEVLQNLLNPNRKFNIVTSGGNIVTASAGGTTFRTAAGNLVAVNLNQATQHQNQQDGQQPQQQTTGTQAQQTHQTVRVSMSALASQLASPPAIMTNPNAANFGYTVSALGGGGTVNTVSAVGGASGGSIKILNSGVQQQRVTLANALRRDSSNTGAPPNAIVVGMAAPSPGSDSNASNASGFAVPQPTSATNSVGTATSLTLLGTATPSPSGSDHSQSSQTQNQALLERLHNNSAAVATAIPNMSPQQQQGHPHTQYLAKTLVQSPAGAASIHSPMSSPHPQPSPSPQHHHHQQQQTTASNTTTTLNLQGINLLQGAIANFPGLQNVQVQIPGLAQPLSLQLQAAVQQQHGQQQQQQQQTQSSGAVSCVVSGGGGTAAGNNVTGGANNSGQQPHLQQRSLLVSVPVSTHNQQSAQQQHTITLQATTGTQQTQNHVQHVVPPTGTIVNLPTGGNATAGGTQTVVLTNAVTGGGGGGGAGVSNVGNAAGNGGATTTMLTLPIAQFVGPGVQKLNPQTIRTSSGGGGVSGGSIVLQQQSPQQQQQQQVTQQQQQQGHQSQQQQTTTTINVSGVTAGSGNGSGIGGSGGGGIVNSGQQTAIQLVGTIQQRPRNIQVVGTKQLSGAQRQLIATQRNIGGSTLKIASTPINVSNANTITTTANLTATPIVMSTQKLQLKTIKTPQQQQQQHARILNQVTATAASQTQTTHHGQQQQQQQQQQQTVIIGQHVASAQAPQQAQQQHIQVAGRTVTTTGNTNLNQQLISAIAKVAKQQQQHQQQQQQQAANRRRSATDVNK
ncbi:uncharacterized protein LOC128860944 isoform X1 [Anastrepha ludens]|uniref:uncharacterized protein LOC128860944 isoform X1 n=1 Tax=Anastrepha ludens TaxID=28586 RepID=UPI0023B14324|nr:uncharacterized protein LOC128860944 isoform X1 [Anastrepha ludens]XP_053954728.1 uncharacterized protein LOC128860944 isoform X1 [Anastrepha ludens]XP_053954729.1 uncharacterized protein LOC128860944 isoform X1 [Anastrepha ludens]XP_053954730.1 uncharacterized protein LOC128860944 isoform X1 [Anastrepha ludens]XP_053954731.1 uncharacterized protein LOC128860944 isoform X1 [Anastrepha ludens]XP_053954732.1 uncharacterized protein LOC128860944 isoform X1 [Anastrepha ludens]XP_053954733.1 un